MSKNTTYSVKLNGVEVETRSKKDKAIELADSMVGQGVITVETQAGTVVHTVEAPATRTHFKPWTRVEAPKFEAPEITGFVPAYTRARVGAVVYRSLDKSGWLVLDTKSGARTECKTTSEAREVTNAMAAAHKVAQAAAKEAAAAAKAQAKADREAAKAAAAEAEAEAPAEVEVA